MKEQAIERGSKMFLDCSDDGDASKSIDSAIIFKLKLEKMLKDCRARKPLAFKYSLFAYVNGKLK